MVVYRKCHFIFWQLTIKHPRQWRLRVVQCRKHILCFSLGFKPTVCLLKFVHFVHFPLCGEKALICELVKGQLWGKKNTGRQSWSELVIPVRKKQITTWSNFTVCIWSIKNTSARYCIYTSEGVIVLENISVCTLVHHIEDKCIIFVK